MVLVPVLIAPLVTFHTAKATQQAKKPPIVLYPLPFTTRTFPSVLKFQIRNILVVKRSWTLQHLQISMKCSASGRVYKNIAPLLYIIIPHLNVDGRWPAYDYSIFASKDLVYVQEIAVDQVMMMLYVMAPHCCCGIIILNTFITLTIDSSCTCSIESFFILTRTLTPLIHSMSGLTQG